VIPFDYITEWRQRAPWVQDAQVEQDLVLSRALVALFELEEIAETLAFRGGTALFKLHLSSAARYSEDIDLVQVKAGPVGPILDGIRAVLDPWLGEPSRSFKEGRVTLIYRMRSEGPPSFPMRLKVEINTREHFSVFGIETRSFEVVSRWFTGLAHVRTYQLDELLGTKLRALYQRKKGRDLFDLWVAGRLATVDADRVVHCFLRYLDHGGFRLSRAEFEENLEAKCSDPKFLGDIAPLLAPSCLWDASDAQRYVQHELLSRLPGAPWKGRYS